MILGPTRSSWPLCRWLQNLLCKLDNSASMPVEIERKFLVAKGGPSVSFTKIKPSGSIRMCPARTDQPSTGYR